MDSLAAKLSSGKEKLAKAKRQGAGSKHVSIDLSSIGRAVRAGGGRIESVIADIERMRAPERAMEAAARAGDASFQAAMTATLILWMLQFEGLGTPVTGGNLAPCSLNDAALSGHGTMHAFADTATAVQGIGFDVPSMAFDMPAISVEVPSVDIPSIDVPAIDIPTISVDVPSFSMDSFN